MGAADILSQDEIDALLQGVERGDVDTGSLASRDTAGAAPYTFSGHDHIVRGRLPTLEMINERVARHLSASLYNLLRRSLEITASEVQTLKFSEYVRKLFTPASINLVKIAPMGGTSLFVFDPKLVFVAVDSFFGGKGRTQTLAADREFTATEMRVVQIVLSELFDGMRKAWAPVLPVEFEHLGSEVDPQFANIVSPSEMVVVNAFHVELDDTSGELHVIFPYAMIEPFKEVLDAGVQSDRAERDGRWANALKETIKSADVEIRSTLTHTVITLRELLELKPGDVVPAEIPEVVVACVDGVPVFRGKFGTSRGNIALEVTDPPASSAQMAGLFSREAISD